MGDIAARQPPHRAKGTTDVPATATIGNHTHHLTIDLGITHIQQHTGSIEHHAAPGGTTAMIAHSQTAVNRPIGHPQGGTQTRSALDYCCGAGQQT